MLRILLWFGSLFYASEFVFHFFGLPILEHDKIFLPTHDRYIALYALTYAALLAGVAIAPEKRKGLFVMTMLGIALGFANASWIAATGGYRQRFSVTRLDDELRSLGVGLPSGMLRPGTSGGGADSTPACLSIGADIAFGLGVFWQVRPRRVGSCDPLIVIKAASLIFPEDSKT